MRGWLQSVWMDVWCKDELMQRSFRRCTVTLLAYFEALHFHADDRLHILPLLCEYCLLKVDGPFWIMSHRSLRLSSFLCLWPTKFLLWYVFLGKGSLPESACTSYSCLTQVRAVTLLCSGIDDSFVNPIEKISGFCAFNGPDLLELTWVLTCLMWM